MRAYFLLFTGCRHKTGAALGTTPRERVAVLTLAVLILAGGLFPQTYLESRQRASGAILQARLKNLDPTADARTENEN